MRVLARVRVWVCALCARAGVYNGIGTHLSVHTPNRACILARARDRLCEIVCVSVTPANQRCSFANLCRPAKTDDGMKGSQLY